MKKLSQFLLFLLLAQKANSWQIRWFWSWPWNKILKLDESPQPDMSNYKYYDDYSEDTYCEECKVPSADAEEFQEGIINWVYHKNLRHFEKEDEDEEGDPKKLFWQPNNDWFENFDESEMKSLKFFWRSPNEAEKEAEKKKKEKEEKDKKKIFKFLPW